MVLKSFVSSTTDLAHSQAGTQRVRDGKRSTLAPTAAGMSLGYYISGLLPFHYRTPENIGLDFAAGHHAIEMVYSLFASLPTTTKFQTSHCGEILASDFVEKVLGYKRLYSKLTLTTAEDTNVHKMDGFFVDLSKEPFHYLLVEAKASVLPTQASSFSGHRHGLLPRMIASIGEYTLGDKRFDLTKIRDNLEEFDPNVAAQIRKDLVPPGPINSTFLGIAVINATTVNQPDDDFILVTPGKRPFGFAGIVVDDLTSVASEAYAAALAIKAAAETAAKKGAADV